MQLLRRFLLAGVIASTAPTAAGAERGVLDSPSASPVPHVWETAREAGRRDPLLAQVGGAPPPLPGADGPRARPPPLSDRPRPPPLPRHVARSGPPPIPSRAPSLGPPPLPQTGTARAAPPPVPSVAGRDRAAAPIIRLVRHTLYDRQGWGEPVEAYSILLPADWSVSGEVAWGGAPNDPTCMSVVPQLLMSARSADGLWGFEILPGPSIFHAAWTRTAPNPYPIDTAAMAADEANRSMAQRFRSPRSYCRVTPNATVEGLAEEALLNAARPGARIVSREPLPHMRERLQQSVNRNPMPGANPPDEVFALRYTITVPTPRGPAVEELGIFATRMTTNMPAFDGYSRAIQMLGLPVFTFRYPPGRKADADPLMTVIANSLRSNPRWDAAMARHRAEIGRINAAGVEERSRIWAETSRTISDMQMEGWRSREESSDRMLALSTDQIREVEPLRDPATGQEYELPNAYSSFYRNPQGEFLMSADPNFKASDLFPYDNWTRLESNPR